MITLAVQGPLVTNPVTIFFIVLVIILLAPVLLNKLKIPHIIGMIVAGVAVGPDGLNVLARDSSFEVFGQVGLLYLMFLAGLEIDMYHLKRNLKRGLVFGLLTFFIPMLMGVVASVYLLHIDWLTSTLLASMYASHTLIGYPVAARYGVTKSPAVLISIVGTIVAVIGALLVLAATVNIHRVGQFEIGELMWLIAKLVIYCLAVLYSYPRVTRWFFKTYGDKVTQFVYVLAMVFLSAWVAGVIGLEPVLGAFFAGLVLNRYVPVTSPLMGRIEFVGNALFIPYFLIGVGMMINLNVIANIDTLIAAGIMLVVALVSKWLAAWIAQRIYHMERAARSMMFGLTTAHTAVALAVVTIGYNMFHPDGTRMMDETILNGTVLVILVTCAIAPIVTSGAAARIKIKMMEQGDEEEIGNDGPHNVLIPVSNPITAQSLVELALFMRGRKRGNSVRNLYALHVRNDNSNSSKAIGRNSLDLARQAAISVDTDLTPIERYDLNTVTGVVNTIEERDVTEVVLGMHRKNTVIDSFLGSKIEQLLKMTNRMVIISRCYIPLNTLTRIVVYVPEKAQFETGFRRWVVALGNLASEVGCRLIFCCSGDVRPLIAGVLRSERIGVRDEYRVLEDRGDFVLLANRVLDDDLFVIVGARVNSVSYSSEMADMPAFLQRYFAGNNLVIIYPEQFGTEVVVDSFADPLASDIAATPSPLWRKLRGWWRTVISWKKRFTQRNRVKKKIDL